MKRIVYEYNGVNYSNFEQIKKFFPNVGFSPNITTEQLKNFNVFVKEIEVPQEELDLMEAMRVKSELREAAIDAIITELVKCNLKATKYLNELQSISDGVALFLLPYFPQWKVNEQYNTGDRILYKNLLYKVLQDHTSQENWKPDISPSLFTKVIRQVGENIPEWQQPSAENAYMKGDKVRFNDKIYESLIDNNVWNPTDYPQGWEEVVK